MFSHQKGSFCVLRGCPKSLKIAFADCPLPSEGGTGVGLHHYTLAHYTLAKLIKVNYSDNQLFL